jgi:hypothetical protein
MIRSIPRLLLGYRIDGTEEEVRALAHRGVVIAFEPVPPLASEKKRWRVVPAANPKSPN